MTATLEYSEYLTLTLKLAVMSSFLFTLQDKRIVTPKTSVSFESNFVVHFTAAEISGRACTRSRGRLGGQRWHISAVVECWSGVLAVS